ncbi:MAG: GIY-YIG nuclease family protein [candidate division Zixibacteria bacterium]|nr:GIY-YIG nuclease family protein [candidate division Zixibacteria bacterium]
MTRGNYQLLLYLDRKSRIKIGKKGEHDFPEGHYVYTGSALNGLEGRINRHLRKEKKNFWHIDYLLPHCKILKVIQYNQNHKNMVAECDLNKELLRKKNCEVVVKGFGSSDCSCPSHLVYFKRLKAIV